MRHGTRVASIAAGRSTGADAAQFGGGVAPEAGLIVVRPDQEDASIGYAKGYIDALAFIDAVATEHGMPVVVNISAGMNAGSHDGTSAVEIACETFLRSGQAAGRAIVKSAGNERQRLRHAVLDVPFGGQSQLSWTTQAAALPPAGVAGDLLELWFPGENDFRFQLQPPGGGEPSPMIDPVTDPAHASVTEVLSNGNQFRTRYTAYHGDNGYGSLRVEVLPGSQREVEGGQWSLVIEAIKILRDEPIHAWIELSSFRRAQFTSDTTDDITITIPGTAEHVITVGAVEVFGLMRSFRNSSRGPTRGRTGAEKPVVVAPGVDIHAAKAGTGTEADGGGPDLSGTSYAAPHVAGAIALVLSARVTAGRPQLNSSQITQALKRSARHFDGRWNNTTGFGYLDVRNLLAETARI